MIAWLGATLGTGVVSAFVPVVNMEAYLIGVLVANPGLSWIVLGVAAAVGQMVGKLVFYWAGRGGPQLAHRLRRRADPDRPRRLGTWVHRFRQTCAERPWTAAGILFASAVIGLPPFAVMAVAAGVARMPAVRFTLIGLAGRAVRFCAVAAAPAVVAYLF